MNFLISNLSIIFFRERLPFTSAYFGSLFATLYFAMALQSTILTTMAASIQVRIFRFAHRGDRVLVKYEPIGKFSEILFSKSANKTKKWLVKYTKFTKNLMNIPSPNLQPPQTHEVSTTVNLRKNI